MAKSTVLPAALIDAMREAGIPVDDCRRVVIDIKSGDVPMIYIEQYGSETVLNIVRALTEVTIERS